ncbi:ferric siderophore ABC transporter substrate-binding protein [Chryseobacterium turcicum]|uniref:Ferric siderophore ABC transporter substrate-binding protein n=1 Tax=Chryseobacterium turcicum TaxID=2898076 RepID=A0A9Q3YU68_9FLAO|nr:ferric siderophore ABC transporter substrate-binding protein [Chryseobacterium turcicum]MCD1115423.1 ferric siderophore ABC transporter substrate-binding protein [Chryseobacterium turcicum]
MRGYTINRAEENKDKIKSAVLSILIWSAILLFVFIYKMEPTEREKEPEVITTMLVNFGDNRNGAGIEEPANQEGSLAAKAIETAPEPTESVVSEPKTVIVPDPKPESKKTEVKDKIITGTNTKVTAPKKEDSKIDKKSTASSTTKSTKGSATTANSKTRNGDGKGTAAIGNLIKGRGTKAGSQGAGEGIGNKGDPLGGDGNGNSKIGIDRKLTDYIPGTYNRGGVQPSHNCTASGSITIDYVVDKAGNITSAKRSRGISDPCIVSTSVAWVKKYVKAEKASVSSSGTYNITF